MAAITVERTPWAGWKTKSHAKRWELFTRKLCLIPDGFGAGAHFTVHRPQRELRKAIDDHLVTVQVVGKGNTKSSTAATMGLHWIADPPPGDLQPYCPVVSGSKEQARAGVYDTAVDIVQQSPELRDLYRVYESLERPRIVCHSTGGIMRPLAPTPRRLHGIKPSLGLVDELGLIHDSRVWRTMVQSLGKRPGARLYGFGTPGWERGELWRLRQQWIKGDLDTFVYWMEWVAAEGCETNNRAELLKANPMRAALDPDGWFQALMVMRATMPEDEFRIFHMAQWPEMTGTKLVDPERWSELADDIHPDDIPPMRFAAIEGDYARRNVAVISCEAYDGYQYLRTEAVWEHQKTEVPVSDIVDAVLAYGKVAGVTMRTTGQLDDVEKALNAEGVPVERMDTHSAAKMRGPTDTWLEAITDGNLGHDGAAKLAEHIQATRLEPRREGLTLTRDERAATDEAARVDAALAAIIALWMARTTVVPTIR